MTEVSEQFLRENALWIIMDPWSPHPFPRDLEKDPNIDQHIEEIIVKISTCVSEVKHVATSCPANYSIHSSVDHYYKLHSSTKSVTDYLEKHGISDVVYVGFHHGRCILNRPTGAIKISRYKKYRLWLKRDLVGILGYDDAEEMDQKSKKYMTFI